MGRVEDVLAEQPLFQGLETRQMERIARAGVLRKVSKGEMLFVQRSEAKGFYVVVDGLIKISTSSFDGREAVLHIYGPGNVFGEVPVFRGGRYPANAEALEDGRVLFLPRETLVRLISEDSTLAMNMLASLSGKLREFAAKIEALTLQEIPQRLAAYLLDLSEREGGATEVNLDITKSMLASFLGATRETLSRALGRMADKGLLEVRGRTIVLRDVQGLSDLAEGARKV